MGTLQGRPRCIGSLARVHGSSLPAAYAQVGLGRALEQADAQDREDKCAFLARRAGGAPAPTTPPGANLAMLQRSCGQARGRSAAQGADWRGSRAPSCAASLRQTFRSAVPSA